MLNTKYGYPFTYIWITTRFFMSDHNSACGGVSAGRSYNRPIRRQGQTPLLLFLRRQKYTAQVGFPDNLVKWGASGLAFEVSLCYNKYVY